MINVDSTLVEKILKEQERANKLAAIKLKLDLLDKIKNSTDMSNATYVDILDRIKIDIGETMNR